MGYLEDTNFSDERKGDVLEICVALYRLQVCHGVNIRSLFKVSQGNFSSWCMQWAMLQRDIHVLRLDNPSAISSGYKKVEAPTRLETVYKYYSLIADLKIVETTNH